MEEKRIEYKAIRKPLMIIFLAEAVMCAIAAVLIIAVSNEYEAFAAFLICTALCAGVAFAVGYINVKTYVFTETGIDVLRGKKLIRRYEITDIAELRYVTLSPAYFARSFDYNARKGASWCFYVFTKDGQKKVLFWLNSGIAKKIQTELYGNLVVIY